MNKTVLIGCPIQNRSSCVDDYLEHIYNLDYPKEDIILAFFVNNSTDETGEIIREFYKEHQKEYRQCLYFESDKILKGRQDNQMRMHGRDYTLFTVVRNTFLKKILRYSWDYFYSVDSDVLVPPDSLKKLLSHGKDVCSALIYNGTKMGYKHYNSYISAGKDKYRVIYEDMVNSPTPIRVDVTGACYLIKRKVLDAGVRYRFFRMGEDGGFCQSAINKGFGLWCDPTIRPEHLLEGKIKNEKDNGRLKMKV
jgi:cellulose synthase/poly-beta-1,6-N-acetylglucosamine synthase-like glycosyltransferase